MSVFVALIFFVRIVLPVGLLVVGVLFSTFLIREFRKHRYFSSDEFYLCCLKLKMLVNEYNDIEQYIDSLSNTDFFNFSVKKTNRSLVNTIANNSKYVYASSNNVDSTNDYVCYCSLQVLKSASKHPIKYLCKYFGIPMNEQSLTMVENWNNRLSKLENAVTNLHEIESDIFQSLKPPKFILKYYKCELDNLIGLKLSKISLVYSKCIFQYVSAGGNSSQCAMVVLNGITLDELASVIASRVKFRKTASGQRSLMTSHLRQRIKERDNYTCQNCGVSIKDEPHLLLEIDHIIPVSKGGLTELSNLQTLCWRCNRKKSDNLV